MPSSEELERFVESLRIPAERKPVVLAELLDHVASAREAGAPEALGDLEALRAALERVEPAFAVTRRAAFLRGLVASLLVAVGIDQLQAWLAGALGAALALGIAVAFAPPRTLALLRRELGAARAPFGPAATYLYTVICAPILIWIGLIVWRVTQAGVVDFDTPPSAFAVIGAGYLLLVVEGVRARRQRAR